MRILIGIGLLIAVATLSGQSGKGTQAPARSATLPADVQPDSLNRLPVVKREQMDENGKKAYDLNAGGPGKVAQSTGPGALRFSEFVREGYYAGGLFANRQTAAQCLEHVVICYSDLEAEKCVY